MVACGSTLKVTKPEADGYYKTTKKLEADDILVAKNIDLHKYEDMFYAQVDENDEQYQDFFKSSIENAKLFNRIVLKSDMEQMVLNKGLTDKITSVSDLIGLHHAQKHLGDFLVGELSTVWKGGHDYTAELKVIDPADGEVIFHAKNSAFNWDGLDQPLFYPLFNSFIEWANKNRS
jgi:hypothetical protein